MPQSVKWSAYICFLQAAAAIPLFLLVNKLAIMTLDGGAFFGTVFSLGFGYCILPIYMLIFVLLGLNLLRGKSWARGATIFAFLVNTFFTFPFGLLTSLPVIVLLFRPQAKKALTRPQG